MLNHKILTAVFCALSIAGSASANVECSLKHINELPEAEMLERYTTCDRLIQQRISLLKKKKEIESLQSETTLSSKLPFPARNPNPGFLPKGEPAIPKLTTSIEGFDNIYEAVVAWRSGRSMRVKKGSYIATGIRVVSILDTGVNIIDESTGQTTFIGLGNPANTSRPPQM